MTELEEFLDWLYQEGYLVIKLDQGTMDRVIRMLMGISYEVVTPDAFEPLIVKFREERC